MPTPKPSYPSAFRQQMVGLVRAGRGIADLAREFGCNASSIHAWVKVAGGLDGSGDHWQRSAVVDERAPSADRAAPQIQAGTSVDFGKRCKEMGVRPSMGSVYNPRRRHSGIGQKPPPTLRRKCKTKPTPRCPPLLS